MALRRTAFKQLVIVSILLLAAGLRFYQLDAQSFWNDEGNSARLSERSVKLIIEGTASDIHPPLYYLMLRAWREFAGDGEFGLRALSAFAGIGAAAATMAAARLLAGSGKKSDSFAVTTAAGLLAAVNPALIYYSQEARMYALLGFWSILATTLLLKWYQQPRRQIMAAYLLTVTAGLYTHYAFPATLLIHGAIAAFKLPAHWHREKGKRLLIWLGMTAAALLLYLPWLPIFLNQASGRGGVRMPLGQFLGDSSRWIAFGPTAPETVLWPMAAAALLLLLGMAAGRQRGVIAASGLALPVMFMFAAGTTQPEFRKFMVVVPPFFALLAGLSWQGLGRAHPMVRLVWLPALALLLWGSRQSLDNLYHNPDFARADYRQMAARIEAEGHANAGIILSAPNQWEVFTYYHRQGAPVYPLPIGQPAPEQLNRELERIASLHDRLYVLYWGERQQDPDGLVERWLDTHTFKARSEWVGDVRFVTYAVPAEAAGEMAVPLGLPFGDAIQLSGYTLLEDQLSAGDILQITLFWQTDAPVSQRYKLFLHLLNQDGQIAAQDDGEPVGGSAPTSSWQPGTTITDNHGLLLPADLPPGEYTLLIGMYDPLDPSARLPIGTDAGVTDSFSLETIWIR